MLKLPSVSAAMEIVRGAVRAAWPLPLFVLLAITHAGLWHHPTTQLYNHVDPVMDSWILRTLTENVWRRPGDLWEGGSHFPSRDALLLCDPLLGPAFLVAPVALVTGNPVAIYNVAIVSVLTLASYGWWRFARTIVGDRTWALLPAVTIPYTPALASHVYQINLLTSAGYPFLLWGLLRLLERPSVSAVLITGVAFAFQAGTSGYHAFACAFLALTVAAWGWRRLRSMRTLAFCASAAVLAGVLLGPYIRGRLRHSHGADLSRGLDEAKSWSLDLATGLLSSHTYVWRPLMPDHGLPTWPGAVLVTLAIVGAARGRSPLRRLLLLISGVFFLLALGPELRVFGHAVCPLPYAVLYEYVPLFNAARRSSFFLVPGLMALGLLAAIGLQWLNWRRSWVIAVLVAAALESLAPAWPRRDFGQEHELPDTYTWLRSQPPGAILELPAEDGDNTIYLWWSNHHRLRTANGVSVYQPNWLRDLLQLIRRQWSRRPAHQDMSTWTSTGMLQSLPLRYLVMHPHMSGYAASHVDATPSVFRLLHASPDGARVYSINRGGDLPLRRRFRDDQLNQVRLRFDVARPSTVRMQLNDGATHDVSLGVGGHDVAPPTSPSVRGLNTLRIEAIGGSAVTLVAIAGDELVGLVR